jgi:hypothetical protein
MRMKSYLVISVSLLAIGMGCSGNDNGTPSTGGTPTGGTGSEPVLVTEITIPTEGGAFAKGMTTSADGSLWVLMSDLAGPMTNTAVFKALGASPYTVTPVSGTKASLVLANPGAMMFRSASGAIWYAFSGSDGTLYLGRIDPKTSHVSTVADAPSATTCAQNVGLADAAAGELWFACGNDVYAIDESKMSATKAFSITGDALVGIAQTDDGTVWGSTATTILSLDKTSGKINASFPIPEASPGLPPSAQTLLWAEGYAWAPSIFLSYGVNTTTTSTTATILTPSLTAANGFAASADGKRLYGATFDTAKEQALTFFFSADGTGDVTYLNSTSGTLQYFGGAFVAPRDDGKVWAGPDESQSSLNQFMLVDPGSE